MPPTESVRTGADRNDREQTYIIRQSNKCYEHRDSQATAMSVDYSGQWVLLAGRGHLALQRLGQDDDGTLRRHERHSKYEVSVAEFAICESSKELCAIATSQHIDIVRWGPAGPIYTNSLRGHTRTVTDIDWHGKDPNFLVSCSIDTFSHIWDLREPRKPSLSLNAVCMSGATQVGFNRVSGNLLAAAHDGDLRIWDIRKSNCPTHYITAHLNRVHGINWSHRRETCLATASQDGTVKYFDVCNPRRAEKIITTLSPVWRARYTPIGNGLVSIVVPHMGRGENSLLLWSNSKQTDPICSFVGHTDVILDFAWRPNRENFSEIELVTWSRDRTLRVWKIDDTMLRLCEPAPDEDETRYDDVPECVRNGGGGGGGATPPPSSSSTVTTTASTVTTATTATRTRTSHKDSLAQQSAISLLPRVAAASLPIATTTSSSSSATGTLGAGHGGGGGSVTIGVGETHIARSLTDQPTCSLHHEFSLLNTNMQHVEVELLDAIKRFACFKICAGGHSLQLHVTFPTSYPSPGVAPEFELFHQESTTTTTNTTTTESLAAEIISVLHKVLRTSALQRVKKSRFCVEYCLRAVVVAMKKQLLLTAANNNNNNTNNSNNNSGSDAAAAAATGGGDKCQLHLQSPRLEGALSSALHDACIPFPRTSGVHFNAVGMLTTFAQVLNTKRLTLRQHQAMTPRTLSAINGSGLLGNVMGAQPVLYTQRDANASFYLQERMIAGKPGKHRAMQKATGSTPPTPIVHIYDASRLLHINREMAQEFSLDKSNIVQTCRQNGEICAQYGRTDLVPIWLLAELIATPHVKLESKYELLFYKDPFKKSLLESLIMHYATAGDVQTAVLLACLFDKCPSSWARGGGVEAAAAAQQVQMQTGAQLAAQVSPYHTVLPVDVKAAAQVRINNGTWQQLRQLRSNSWSDSLDWAEVDAKLHQLDVVYACSLIRQSKMPLFDQFKSVYAEILYGWQLLPKRALILKHTLMMEATAAPVPGVEFVTECGGCAKPKRMSKCEPCKRPVLYCMLCSLPVKGSANACLACGHGGHIHHIMQWFENHNICATGCGCRCLERTEQLLSLIN